MAAVLVDANVLLDALDPEAIWHEWSTAALAGAAGEDLLVINPLIYAEVSIGFEQLAEVEAALPPDRFQREALPWEAAFRAGKAFREYRRRGGTRRSPLPDFYIGAHAEVAGHRLLTRDARRYRTYFPTVELIAPEEESTRDV